MLQRPEIREALWLASPGLFDRLSDWLDAPASERGQAVERPLVRYHARMAGRATPFGLFAGWSLGDIDDETALTLGPRADYQRVSRLDMGYVGALCRALEQHPALLSRLVLRPNSSLFRALHRRRYVTVASTPGGGRRYRFMAAHGTEALDETLERAAAGASLDALAQALVEPDISHEDARDFVREQVQHQLLETDLAPMLTGSGPDDAIASTLGRCPETAALGAAFAAVRDELAALDAAGVGNDVERYRTLAGRLSALVPSVSIDLARLFQVDLIKPAAGERLRLGGPPLAELLRAVTLLHRVASPPADDGPLSAFRAEFVRRYGDRQLPLAQIVDDDLGIAFERADSMLHMPLVKGLPFPPPRRVVVGASASASWSDGSGSFTGSFATNRSNHGCSRSRISSASADTIHRRCHRH
ncbi:lantibiotic dehydratase [Nannocystis pusilla]|uniref:lantibiotic dehydratase n=1 Tax=Nannocystis pusilla TaxID=889268 RepID=UPI003B7825FE